MTYYYLHARGVCLRFGLCFLLLFHLVFGAMAQTGSQTEPGVVRIKVSEAYARQLESARVRVTPGNVLQTGMASLDAAHQRVGARKMKRVFPPAGKFEAKHRRHGLHLWYEIEVDEQMPLPSVLQSYQLVEGVVKVEAVHQKTMVDGSKRVYKPFVPSARERGQARAGKAIFNDPHLDYQWHYDNHGQTQGKEGADINLFRAWGIEAGKTPVIVALTDGGVDYKHPDLQANMWVNKGEIANNGVDDDGNGYVDDIHGYSFVDARGNMKAHPHGTHVAGTVAATNNNGIGVAGVAGGTGKGDGVRIMSCAVFKELSADLEIGGGFENTYIYAADNGAVISQNSWGYTRINYYEQVVLDAIDYFIDEAGTDENGIQTGPMKGGIVIFAAGNDGISDRMYPGYYDRTLAVSGLTHVNKKAWYSNYGTWLDIAAPGGDTNVGEQGVLSTFPDGKYAYADGTSMACPHVSGVAALLVSKFGGPGYTPDQLRARLLSTAVDVDDDNADYAGQLGKRVDAFQALRDDEEDNIAPAAVNDLAVTSQTNTGITLTWTAPNDGATRPVGRYDLRYATDVITEATFDQAMPVANKPRVSPAGMTEAYTFRDVTAKTTYYFALRAYDVAGNVSSVSNVVSGTTLAMPVIGLDPIPLIVELQPTDEIQRDVYIINYGEGPLQYTIEANGDWGQLEEYLHYLTFSKRTGVVEPGGRDKVTLTFKTVQQPAVAIDEVFTIRSNDPSNPGMQLPILFKIAETKAFPIVSASTLDFGPTPVQAQSMLRLDIRNGGTQVMMVDNLQVDNPAFTTAMQSPYWIGGFGALQLKVFYHPTATGNSTGTLTLHTDDPDNPVITVALVGEGIAAPALSVTPTSLSASLPTGGKTTREVTITNTGSAPMTYTVVEQGLPSEKIRVLVMCPDGSGAGVPFLLTHFKELQVDVHDHLPDLTLADMLTYDVVFVMNNEPWMRYGGISAEHAGDLLADYVDAGGRVLLNQFAYTGDANYFTNLNGRFMLEHYGPFESTSTFYGMTTTIGEKVIGGHPILDGVEEITFSGDIQLVALEKNAAGIAKWANGEWMVAAKPNVVALNFMPVGTGGSLNEFWTGDVPTLLRNALHWLAGSAHLTATPSHGTLAAGATTKISVEINAEDMASGHYTSALGIAANVPVRGQAIVTLGLDVQGPDFTFASDSVVLSTSVGTTASEPVGLRNEGLQAFPYRIRIENVRKRQLPVSVVSARAPKMELPSGSLPTSSGWQGGTVPASEELSGNSPVPDGPVDYATTFEGFRIGDIHGQEEWQVLGASQWTIATTAPSSGVNHLSFRGNASERASAVVSPRVVTGRGSKSVCSVRLKLVDRTTTFEVVPLAYPSGLGVTAVRFGADGTQSVTVFNEVLQFGKRVPLPAALPSDYFTLSIEVEHATSVFSIYINQTKVFEGAGMTSTINALAFQSYNEGTGRVLIDDVSVGDGGFDALPAFLTVTPVTGVLNAGAVLTLDAVANAAGLLPGAYFADIVVDIADGVDRLTLPARVQVTGPGALAVNQTSLMSTVDFQSADTTYIELRNTGGETIHFSLDVPSDMAPWLTVKPASGDLSPDQIAISRAYFDARTLDAGSYSGFVVVGGNNPATDKISVALRVRQPAHILPGTERVDISLVEGERAYPSLVMGNDGESILKVSFTSKHQGSWILNDKTVYAIASGETRGIGMTLDATSLPAGVYRDTLLVTTNDPGAGMIAIPIQLSVEGAPVMTTSAEDLVVTLMPGTRAHPTFEVGNAGAARLLFDVASPVIENPTPYHGGPDQHGYTFMDSRHPGGPAFRWNDIRERGTVVTLGDTDSSSLVLPFVFQFYGEQYRRVKIASDGFLAFGAVGDAIFDHDLFNPAAPNNFIAAHWDDLDPSVGGKIYFHDEGDRFVVQYTDVPRFSFSGVPDMTRTNTFQIVLYPDGSIEFHYLDIATDAYQTVGIENADATDALVVRRTFDGGFSADSTTILITPAVPWLRVMGHASDISGGEKQMITVEINAEELALGTYEHTVYITSNVKASGVKRLPVRVRVTDGVTGIAPDEATSLRLYPVPVNDVLHIRWHESTGGQVQLTLRNTLGQPVWSQKVSSHMLENYAIAVGSLRPGMYVLQLTSDEGLNRVRSFIKE